MTKPVLIFSLMISLLSASKAQHLNMPHRKDIVVIDTSFQSTINHFQRRSRYLKETIQLPILVSTNDFKVVLADSAWHLQKQEHRLGNPFSSDKANKFPLSYSVFYLNRLVSLFAPGYFTCFNPDNWQRDLALEEKLNTKQFEQHWLADGKLVALTSGKHWQFSPETGWKRYAPKLPFTNQPKLFEDANYLVYMECKGEFGGQVYFYDKQTRKTHWKKSTCAVWVRHTDQGYEILSNLGHMMGFTDKDVVSNPRALPEWKNSPKTTRPDSTTKSLFSFHGLQLFGGFTRQNKPVYLLFTADRTYLATLNDTTFTIVDPLFNKKIYTHEPVSTSYQNLDLINMDYYGVGGRREVVCLLIKGNLITLLSWQ